VSLNIHGSDNTDSSESLEFSAEQTVKNVQDIQIFRTVHFTVFSEVQLQTVHKFTARRDRIIVTVQNTIQSFTACSCCIQYC